MFKAFIVFIEVVLLVTVLRTPFMQYWLGDMQDTATEWMTVIAEIPDKQEISQLYDNIQPAVGGMTEKQREYLDEVMRNRQSVEHFHRQYCVNGDMNPFIYGTSLRVVCREMTQSALLSMQRAS
ncbi:hypothetical protein [Alteromonas flava]|uniref:hypothetical protein n=1 Tax=Alteromonas flava TaxID=2048003 RepID=UPI000C284047|nr:hypothetical protein [Alteromonas flava]